MCPLSLHLGLPDSGAARPCNRHCIQSVTGVEPASIITNQERIAGRRADTNDLGSIKTAQNDFRRKTREIQSTRIRYGYCEGVGRYAACDSGERVGNPEEAIAD